MEIIEKDGTSIKINGILTEMITNVTEAQPFSMKVPALGDVEVGGGSVKIALPFIDKKMVLNSADLINFKNYMLRK